MRGITIRPVGAACSDGDVAAIHAIAHAIGEEVGGAGPVESVAEMTAAIRADDAGRPRRHWLARAGDGTPIGAASLSWRITDPPRRVAGFGVDVLSPARRRGVGTRLLGEVLEAAAAEGRSLLQTWTREDGLGEPFLRAYGGRRGSVAHTATLDLRDVDRTLLESWISRAGERAAGYSLVSWQGACPVERREQLVRVLSAMNTAPRGELEADDAPLTVESLVAEERREAEAGLQTWCVCARHDAGDDLVGVTAVGLRPDGDEARQGDTVVEPEHRERGLGRWMKGAMLLRILDEQPSVRRITTGTMAGNAAMRSINDAMGFRVIRADGVWQLPVDTARVAVAARLAASGDGTGRAEGAP